MADNKPTAEEIVKWMFRPRCSTIACDNRIDVGTKCTDCHRIEKTIEGWYAEIGAGWCPKCSDQQ